jgi:hypothetical protein
MTENRKQQPEEKNPKTNSETKRASAHQEGVSVSDRGRRPAAIKGLELVGATGLALALYLITIASHKISSILILFISLSSFVLAVYLTWLPSLKKAVKRRRLKIKRNFLLTETLVAILCFSFPLWSGRNEQHAKSEPPSSPVPMLPVAPLILSNQKAFQIRHHGFVMFPVFPQPLLYTYSFSSYLFSSSPDKFIAPVGLAVNVEVLNTRPTTTKVQSYEAELETDINQWTPIKRLPMTEPHDIFFVEGDSLKSCVKLDFKPHIFDMVASQKNLSPGESLDGWMFFEWPPELHENKKLCNVKVRLKNSQGEMVETVINVLSNDEPGESSLNEGSFGPTDSKTKTVDLSSLLIRPFSNE